MSNVRRQMPSPEAKLAEAEFFLELFEALEFREESLTQKHSKEAEASFLFSATLGAFYAALDQWHKIIGDHKAYQSFKKRHPEVHGSTEQGGWRNLTVHLSHIDISETAFVPTLGFDAHVRISASKLGQSDHIPFAPFQVHLPQYCVSYRGQSKPVLEFCREHLLLLRQLFIQGLNASLPP
jgi:hypothetical protein